MRKGRFADAIQRADLFSQLLIIEVQSMIKLEHIEVTFGSFKALKDINIDIHEGEFFTFLGPSGCGKTTTLRTITGSPPSKSATSAWCSRATLCSPP